jgi:hypothetical protein
MSSIKPTEDDMIIFIKVAEYLAEQENKFGSNAYNSYLIGIMISSIIISIIYLFNPSLISYGGNLSPKSENIYKE